MDAIYAIGRYLERVGIAVSVLINVILGGPSNQAFSARNYAWKRSGKPNAVWFIDRIFFFESDHCMNSWIYWKIRKNLNKMEMKYDNNIWKSEVRMVPESEESC